jgi:hypothetical protein
MSELVAAGNALWDLQVPAAIAKLPGAKAAVFNSHQLVCSPFLLPFCLFSSGEDSISIKGTLSSQTCSTLPQNSLTAPLL